MADEAFDRVWKQHMDMLRSARSAVAVEELPAEDVAQLLEDYKTLRAERDKYRTILEVVRNLANAADDENHTELFVMQSDVTRLIDLTLPAPQAWTPRETREEAEEEPYAIFRPGSDTPEEFEGIANQFGSIEAARKVILETPNIEPGDYEIYDCFDGDVVTVTRVAPAE